MSSDKERFKRARLALEEQISIQNAARIALGENVSLKRLSSGLLEAALRTLEEAGLTATIPKILRAAADNYENADEATRQH